jgi:hypothetical protein
VTHVHLPLFASKAAPLRASKLPGLMLCPIKEVLLDAGLMISGDSIASHTGRAVHKAVEVFHKTSFDEKAAVKETLRCRHEYRKMEEDKVLTIFRGYARDPRNRVPVVLSEQELTAVLDPWPTDQTKEPVYLIGHVDQVREVDGNLSVFDIKVIKDSGEMARDTYTYQLVMYAVMATKLMGRDVHPGGIIRASSYHTAKNKTVEAPDDVFFHYPFKLEDCRPLLDNVRRRVAEVRNREALPNPCNLCTYCPAGNVRNCFTTLKEYWKLG